MSTATKEVFYTIFGKHQGLDDEQNPLAKDEITSCAKKIYSDNRKTWRYYVRLNNEGVFYNPIGMYDEMTNRTAMRAVARDKFIEVTPKVFELYLAFLRTKNIRNLLIAQREY